MVFEQEEEEEGRVPPIRGGPSSLDVLREEEEHREEDEGKEGKEREGVKRD